MPVISLKSLLEPDAAPSPAPRIGIVIAHLGSGGAEKAAVVLANGLTDRGYFVDLLTWQAAGFHLKDMSAKVARIDLSAGRRPNSLQVIASLMRYMRQQRPAIIFPHLEKPSLLVIAGGLLTGYRKIVPCIQIDLFAYAAIHPNLRHRLRRWLLICFVAVLYRSTPRVVAVSEGVAQTARRLLSPLGPSVQVIYNGLDYRGLAFKAHQQVEEVWLLQKTVPVIVTCGRLTQQKAQDTLLRAFAELRRVMPVRLVILGEGEEHEALLALARQLGVAADVLLPGTVAEPIAWFAKSDLFVLPSRCEGQALVLIEALLAGVPIVSTDCPSGPREVLAHGRFGTLVPVDDIAALTEAMSHVLKSAPDIDKGALTQHLEKFTAERMVDGYLAAGSACCHESFKGAGQPQVR